MNGSTTEITDPDAPNDPPRKFTFDYSYWSHDGFEKNDEGYLQPTVPHYADQVHIFGVRDDNSLRSTPSFCHDLNLSSAEVYMRGKVSEQ
jgi:hypothetical protein